MSLECLNQLRGHWSVPFLELQLHIVQSSSTGLRVWWVARQFQTIHLLILKPFHDFFGLMAECIVLHKQPAITNFIQIQHVALKDLNAFMVMFLCMTEIPHCPIPPLKEPQITIEGVFHHHMQVLGSWGLIPGEHLSLPSHAAPHWNVDSSLHMTLLQFSRVKSLYFLENWRWETCILSQ